MTLLIVDDEKSVREMTRLSINCTRAGISMIFEAGSGQEALEILRTHHPDVTLLDMNMPGMNGTELMQHMKEEGLTTNLVIISGYDDFSYAKQALIHNAVNYILKPINVTELNDTLTTISVRLAHRPAATLPFLDSPDQHVLDAWYEFTGILAEHSFTTIQVHINNAETALRRFGQDAELMALEIITCLGTLIGNRGLVVKNLNSSQMIYVFLKCATPGTEHETALNFCKQANEALNRQGLDCAFGVADQTGTLSGCRQALCYSNLRNAPFFFESNARPIPIATELMSLGMREGLLCALRLHHSTSMLRVARAVIQNLKDEDFICISFLYALADELNGAYRQSGVYRSNDSSYTRIFDSLDLHSVLDRMLEWISDSTPPVNSGGSVDDLTARVVEYIFAHYSESITLDVLARALFSSREHICKQFKKSMGVNLSTYLRNMRLERAFMLVQRTGTPISDIAQAVGFTDTSYFIKIFRQRYGCAPSSLRKPIS